MWGGSCDWYDFQVNSSWISLWILRLPISLLPTSLMHPGELPRVCILSALVAGIEWPPFSVICFSYLISFGFLLKQTNLCLLSFIKGSSMQVAFCDHRNTQQLTGRMRPGRRVCIWLHTEIGQSRLNINQGNSPGNSFFSCYFCVK